MYHQIINNCPSDFVESTDAKQDIRRFIAILYGESITKGHLVLWTKSDKRSSYFRDIDEAATHAVEARESSDVYFGIGLQAEATAPFSRGGKENVVAIPGFWMDIDIQGTGHKQTALPEDRSAAMKFLEHYRFPPTLVVSSGHGLHAYWLFFELWMLENDGDRDRAAEMSRKFQQSIIECGRKFGYQLDYTGDLSRLLRLPGTFNHKADPVPVEVVLQNEDCIFEPDELDRNSDTILEGCRNNSLTSIGGSLRACGADAEEISEELHRINNDRCSPPLPNDEVERIAKSVSRYEKGDNGNRPKTQAQRVVELGEGMELFHTSDSEAYARFDVNGHKEVWPLKSTTVRSHLGRLYYKETNGIPGAQGMQDALGILEAKALYDSPERKVHLRVAEDDACIYLDLCNDNWEIVRIDQEGWNVSADAPVIFRRAKGMGSLPKPRHGGKTEDLYRFVNADESSRCLITAFLIACLRPGRPFPILILQGEQGSAKSTTAKMVRELIDPSASPLRSLPGGEHDLMLSANNGWILAYDNLSGINKHMSDTLCRISTRGGFSTRKLYSDGEEKIFDSGRPVILNGIDNIANRGDLADRSLIINLPRISKEKRKLEDDIWREFNESKPFIIGALLDAVSVAIGRLDRVKLPWLPRMADFAKWIIAAEPALPWEPGTFMEILNRNKYEANNSIFESDLVARELKKFIEHVETWEGTATELLKALEEYIGREELRHAKDWPKNPSYLSNRIKRVAPTLREIGFKVEQPTIRGTKLWRFEAPAN